MNISKLRTGEKNTGELFQDSTAPFNLAGETATDFGARQAEQEKRENDAAASDLRQESLF